jgi:hypothetical protein
MTVQIDDGICDVKFIALAFAFLWTRRPQSDFRG